jgi:hypothetical protein
MDHHMLLEVVEVMIDSHKAKSNIYHAHLDCAIGPPSHTTNTHVFR